MLKHKKRKFSMPALKGSSRLVPYSFIHSVSQSVSMRTPSSTVREGEREREREREKERERDVEYG